MTIRLENQLRFPVREFEADLDAHLRNIRAVELWAAAPADFFALRDLGATPAAADMPLGSLVRVGDELQWLTSTGWVTLFNLSGTTTIANPSGGGTQDAEARAAINSLLTHLENIGILDP